jgi:hypothetical protein
MKNWTKWKRLDLEAPGEPSLSQTEPARRKEAERQTNNDLKKPIQQLICDIHEEVSTRRNLEENLNTAINLNHAIKRMVSMMGRVALGHEYTSKVLVRFTIVLTVLTAAIVFLTLVLIFKSG